MVISSSCSTESSVRSVLVFPGDPSMARLADEGLDIPSLRAVVLASGGKSETRALQRVGRALRTAPGKTEAIVVDFFDNAPYLKEHSMARLELFRNEPTFRVETVGFRA